MVAMGTGPGPIRPEPVVAGQWVTDVQSKRNPCDRNTPLKNGALGGIRTPDRRFRRPELYPAELPARDLIAELSTAARDGDYKERQSIWLRKLRNSRENHRSPDRNRNFSLLSMLY